MRLELQAEKGDTQVLYDGHTVSIYDAATNTLYRYTPPAEQTGDSARASPRTPRRDAAHEVPTRREDRRSDRQALQHANVSGATPTDVAGQPAYTVRVPPKESGSLIGGAELSFDAVHGVPLRAAMYSSTSSSPVIELAASEISYGPVADSVFAVHAARRARRSKKSTLPKSAADEDARRRQRKARPSERQPRTGTASPGSR